jgi:L-asparaginase
MGTGTHCTRRALIAGTVALALSPKLAAAAAPLAKQQPLPNIAILGTGGTIASGASSSTQLTRYKVDRTVDQLVAAVPGIDAIARLSGEQVFNVGSGNITDQQLLQLARRVNTVLASSDVDGVVITHGTDTLEETAYFLNLTVKNAKPIVIVGAMRPATAMSADGPLNLYNAVLLAGSPEARGKGVLVMMNDRILSAREATKSNADAVDAFKSAEQGALGAVVGGKPYFYQAPMRRHTTVSEFDVSKLTRLPRVDILYEHQGASAELYSALADLGTKGIVVAAFGRGGLSAISARAAAEVNRRQVIVVRSSRVGSGTVPHSPTLSVGTVTGDSLNPQKARILLMLALTKTKDPSEIQRYFDTY